VKSNPPSLEKREGVVCWFYFNIVITIIFTCLLNSPPLKGGVASVSRKETEDEVVFAWARLLFRLRETAPSGLEP
jgi:hypothetical protein